MPAILEDRRRLDCNECDATIGYIGTHDIQSYDVDVSCPDCVRTVFA